MRGDENVLRVLEDSPVVRCRVAPKAYGEALARSLARELRRGFATVDHERRTGNVRHGEASFA